MALRTLIITEKPSVAVAIAAVLGIKKKGKEYFENQEYLISWCYGHLAQFADAYVYEEKFRKWKLEDLPIIPKEWQYSVDPKKITHLSVLKELMQRNDIGTVVNACDAGR
ncbi:MAG: toprim domain-containing protein, partial [Clostridia bacterium]|nr:toprim domain-containing protein [Clostridia bacterium]